MFICSPQNTTKEVKCCYPLLPDKKTGEPVLPENSKKARPVLCFLHFPIQETGSLHSFKLAPYSLFTAWVTIIYIFFFLLRNCLTEKLLSNTSRRIKPLSSACVLGLHQNLSSLSGVLYAHRSNYGTVKWNSKESSSRVFRN